MSHFFIPTLINELDWPHTGYNVYWLLFFQAIWLINVALLTLQIVLICLANCYVSEFDLTFVKMSSIFLPLPRLSEGWHTVTKDKLLFTWTCTLPTSNSRLRDTEKSIGKRKNGARKRCVWIFSFQSVEYPWWIHGIS